MSIIGNGVDIIEVRRIKSAIDKYGCSFLERIFTDKELQNAEGHNNRYQHLAGRFAAKEAVFKALGKAGLRFKDVQILNDRQGKPFCSLTNSYKDKFKVYISISHIKNYAVASAIITQGNSSS
ncbi:MAG: holo-ACP synthase [Candidatus Omnitrophota bacterium]